MGNLLVEDPILIFSILAMVILGAPLLAERFRIPDIVLLIAAGAILGPRGLGILARSSAVTLFGAVGLLYIMFLAGLEIDLYRFARTRGRSIGFGLLTFAIPQTLGTLGGHYILGLDWVQSILLASMFASHTLLAYPIASRLGISRSEPVAVTVGATIITDTLALLVLAVIADSARGVGLGVTFWIGILIGMIVLVMLTWWGIPWLTRWFFQHFTEKGGAQFMFVLVSVCIFSYLSHYARLEPIIGAFLAGAAFNRMIPEHSALMNRVVFVGNNLFIPFFLISVGMLVDLRALVSETRSLQVGVTMIVLVIATKYLAAWIAGKKFGYPSEVGNVMFGLSVVQAAATLAAVVIGYELKIFDDAIMNGTIGMILVTCPLGSWMVERYGRIMAAQEQKRVEPVRREQRLMVFVANPESAIRLLDLAFLLRDTSLPGAIYPITIVREEGDSSDSVARGEKLLAHCMAHAASFDTQLYPSVRVDINVSDGITRAAREVRASAVLVGWGREQTSRTRFFRNIMYNLLDDCSSRLIFCRTVRPLNTTRRLLVPFPPLAERRLDLPEVLRETKILAQQTGADLQVYFTGQEDEAFRQQVQNTRPICPVTIIQSTTWGESREKFFRDIQLDDMVLLHSERRSGVLWTPTLDRLPEMIVSRFPEMNFLVTYPALPISRDSSVLEPIPSSDVLPAMYPTDLDHAATVQDALEQMTQSAFVDHPEILHAALPLLVSSASLYPVELASGAVLVHAHCDKIDSTLLLVGSGKSGVPFPNLAMPPKVILALLSSKSNPPEVHLKTLAEVARRFHNKAIAREILKASSATEVCEILGRKI